MRRTRLRQATGVFALLLFGGAWAAHAQLPLLDTLSRDPTDDSAYGALPWASLTDFPTPCDPGYFVQGATDAAYDCQPALVLDGAPSDGDCPIYNSGTGTWRPGPCGSGLPILVLGPDYVYIDVSGTDKLLYYSGA